MTFKKETHELERFETAQAQVWPFPLEEIQRGKKREHWMWYVFPQISGLGKSKVAMHYSISGLEEARDYLAHPVLGARLIEISKAMMALENLAADVVLGGIDALKLQSSATLFQVADGGAVFGQLLDKYFDGESCPETLALIKQD